MATIRERSSKDGKSRYHVQVRLKGYPPQTASFARKTDAKAWAQQTEAAIREGRHFKTVEAKRHTLAETIDRYVATVLINTPDSYRDRAQQLRWWKDKIGDYLLAEVSPALLVECRDDLAAGITVRKKPRSPATVKRYLAALSHVFTIAVKEWGWLEDNPALKITKPKEPRGRVRFLSDDERNRLLVACQKSNNPYLYPVVVLALSTGMRQAEILNLRWHDVDRHQGRITLHETKNDERRVVPLVGRALELMQEHAKVRALGSDLLFPAKKSLRQGRKEVSADLRKPWQQALRSAQIDDFRFHDLRHSAASYLAMNGASLAEIAEVLGHKTLAMVRRYAHLSEAHTAGVVARMNERIFPP
ncbi:MAG: site-specific integrase [Gammaproteobacteria bacterium]|nr:site-specific integrase [Gammaproteobacteria bacterium]MDJ0890405.1 site-specific integrase [Gammaproteobacteria bacterium]